MTTNNRLTHIVFILHTLRNSALYRPTSLGSCNDCSDISMNAFSFQFFLIVSQKQLRVATETKDKSGFDDLTTPPQPQTPTSTPSTPLPLKKKNKNKKKNKIKNKI